MFSIFDPSYLTPFPGMAALTNRYRPTPIDIMETIRPALAQANETARREDERKQQAAEQAARQRQLDLQQASQAETARYHDIENQRYQATDARLQKSELDKHIAEIQKALPEAQSSGDQAKVQALLQELGRLTGWQMNEQDTNYQAPPAQPAPGPQAGPGAPPQLPGSFDAAYDAMVQKESGGNPRAVNPKSGALGTFQLMPDQLHGMTKEQFLALSPEEQKQYYLNDYLPSHKLSADTMTPGDVGLSVGAPAAISMPDDAVVYKKGSQAVAQNPKWDRNKDGQITARELRANYRGGPPAGIARPPEPQAPQGPPAQFLQDYMQGQGPTQEQAPSGAMPWDLLGLGPAPAAPKNVPGGGRWVFTDAAGNTQYEYDRPKVQAEQRDAVKASMQPLLDNATTDEEKKAARAAMGFASAAVGNGLNPKEAYAEGMKFYEKSLSEAGKTARVGTANGYNQLHSLQKDAEDIHRDTMRQFGIPQLNTSEVDLRKGLDAITATNGMGDTEAFGRFMKDLEGGRISDQDVKRYSNATGWVNDALNIYNKLLTGKKPPEVMTELRALMEHNLQLIQQRKQEAADNAYMGVYSGSQYPLVPEEMRTSYAQRARDRILGVGPSTKPTATAGGYAGKSLDDLEKELGQ